MPLLYLFARKWKISGRRIGEEAAFGAKWKVKKWRKTGGKDIHINNKQLFIKTEGIDLTSNQCLPCCSMPGMFAVVGEILPPHTLPSPPLKVHRGMGYKMTT